MKVYVYKSCSTCQKALKYLKEKGIECEVLPIVEQPPSLEELQWMLGQVGSLGALFNTSGAVYREMGLSERLKAGLPIQEALQLLAQNGKLIKRPFLVSDRGGAVGFRADVWDKLVV